MKQISEICLLSQKVRKVVLGVIPTIRRLRQGPARPRIVWAAEQLRGQTRPCLSKRKRRRNGRQEGGIIKVKETNLCAEIKITSSNNYTTVLLLKSRLCK